MGDAERELAARRELFAVLAHEFRSPIGAILGFEELLSEGILGEMPAAARDALTRIRSSALQLLDLVGGLNDLAIAGRAQLPSTSAIQLDALLAEVMEKLATEAAGRAIAIQLDTPGPLPEVITDAERTERALQLTLMAAVKTSAGGRIDVHVGAGEAEIEIAVSAPGLDPHRDEPELSLNAGTGPKLSGAGLRIAMARQAILPLGGQIILEAARPGALLRLRLPRQSSD